MSYDTIPEGLRLVAPTEKPAGAPQRISMSTFWVFMLGQALIKKAMQRGDPRTNGKSGRALRRAMGDYRTARRIAVDEAHKQKLAELAQSAKS